jgi:hypothetical protein
MSWRRNELSQLRDGLAWLTATDSAGAWGLASSFIFGYPANASNALSDVSSDL